jgi:hypothetical protein
MLIKLKYLSNLDNFDKSIINLASERDQKEAVKLVIPNDVDLSRTLHEAALWNHNDVLKILLNAKLDLNKKDSKGSSWVL